MRRFSRSQLALSMAASLWLASSLPAVADPVGSKRLNSFFYCDDARTLGIAPPPACVGQGGGTRSGAVGGGGGSGAGVRSGANNAARVSAGIAAGAAAIGILGSIAESIAAANPQPDPGVTAFYAQKKAEDLQFQAQARDMNERARQLAAADRDEDALKLFRTAYATAQRGNEGSNALIYYRNMHMMESRISYRKALALYEAGKLTEASKAFQRARHFAQSAQDEALAGKIKNQHDELIRVAADLPSPQRREINESNKHCVSVNGQLMCQ